MIVGTAGHIDHGKTTLVKALTGVDTDRLPQEKARGISIELGYAFLDPAEGGARIGFIDVPGHERLVHTMLAGATGIDYALLLVAADDGPMPQTREHLAVLSLLGVARGAVAITKTDRVDADRIEQVRAEVTALLAGTPLEDAPVLAVSARTGDGLPRLRELLFAAAREGGRRAAATHRQASFRLAIDRAFTLAGIGTVVTGTAHAGRVRVGDALALAPSSGSATLLRVRSLHAQNHPVAEACAGERCAIGLVGVDKQAVGRGQWLVAPEIALATDRFDAELTVWRGEARALRSGTPVHVHLGAVDAMGTVAVLRSEAEAGVADALAPGQRGWVQVVLREPIAVWRGDRVVLRDTSATRTLGGGTVLDPCAPARQRRTPQRLSELAAAGLADPGARLAARVAASSGGVALGTWARAEGIAESGLPPLPPDTLLAADTGDGRWALGAAHHARLADATLAALQGFHAREPDAIGLDAARLRRVVAPRLAEAPWRALLAGLRADGRVALRGAFVQLPEHALRLSATDTRIAQKLAPLLAAGGFDGCWARDLARDTREGEALLRTTIARLAQHGELHQVVRDLCYPVATIARLVSIVRTLAAADAAGAVTAARFRDATGLGRKRAIQILEYFDRIGLLRRTGEVHRLRTDSALFIDDV